MMSENSVRSAERDSVALPFFVYGTLLPGQPNHYLFGEDTEYIGPARYVGGRLYDMGAYPMLVEDGANTTIVGRLVVVGLSRYAQVLGSIDALEGYDPNNSHESPYRRVSRPVIAEGEQTVMAWLYVGRPRLVSGREVVPNGDWIAHSQQNIRLLTSWWRDIDSVTSHLPGDR